VAACSQEEVVMRPLPQPPEGFLRVTIQCQGTRCQMKRQLLMPEAGMPEVGTILRPSDGWGDQVICMRCRRASMALMTAKPQPTPAPPPAGWDPSLFFESEGDD